MSHQIADDISSGLANHPLRVLVLQLSKPADTMQSLMALKAIQHLYPRLEIHMVVREESKAIAQSVPFVRSVLALSNNDFSDASETMAISKIAKWVRPLVQEPYDFVVNWTYSEASSYLATLIPAVVKLGYYRRKDMTLACAEGWSQYLQGVIQNHLPQEIHLTDIFTTQLLTAMQIHLGDPERSAGNEAASSKDFFRLDTFSDPTWSEIRATGVKWLGVAVRSTQTASTIPADLMAGAINSIMLRHPSYHVVMIGGGVDEYTSDEIFDLIEPQFQDRVYSRMTDSFTQQAEVVRDVQWLISADSHLISMASLLGTRVLELTYGPVRFLETGPYGTGHYIMTTEGHWDPSAISATFSYAQSEWMHRNETALKEHFSNLSVDPVAQGVRVYRSEIRSNELGGGVYYRPLLEGSLDIKSFVATLYGQVCRKWYCGWGPEPGTGISRSDWQADLISQLRILREPMELLRTLFEQSAQTARKLEEASSKAKANYLMSLDQRQGLQKTGERLMELEKLLKRTAELNPLLRGFYTFQQVQMHNLQGESLGDLAKESARAYDFLEKGIRLALAWTDAVIGKARPERVVDKTIVLPPDTASSPSDP